MSKNNKTETFNAGECFEIWNYLTEEVGRKQDEGELTPEEEAIIVPIIRRLENVFNN